MHGHPLHRPVRVECLCCHIDATFLFKSKHDHVICKGCERHQGDSNAKLKLKDRDHINIWRSELELAVEDAAEREAALKQKIGAIEDELTQSRTEAADLRESVRRGFDEAPPLLVERWLTNEAVTAARDRQDSAYRSRDRALRVVWKLDRIHRVDTKDENNCTCGKRMQKCREAQALAPIVDALADWENKQVDRLRQGLTTGLPEEHPEMLKYGHHSQRFR